MFYPINDLAGLAEFFYARAALHRQKCESCPNGCSLRLVFADTLLSAARACEKPEARFNDPLIFAARNLYDIRFGPSETVLVSVPVLAQNSGSRSLP